MSFVFLHSLDDYSNDPIVIKFNPTISIKNTVFPAVSICISKIDDNGASTRRIENFVKKYYAEYNIEVPEE